MVVVGIDADGLHDTNCVWQVDDCWLRLDQVVCMFLMSRCEVLHRAKNSPLQVVYSM